MKNPHVPDAVSKDVVRVALMRLMGDLGINPYAVYITDEHPVVISDSKITVHVVPRQDADFSAVEFVKVGDGEFAEWAQVASVPIKDGDA